MPPIKQKIEEKIALWKKLFRDEFYNDKIKIVAQGKESGYVFKEDEFNVLVSMDNFLDSAFHSIAEESRENEKAKSDELAGALLGMYTQYCSDGHSFMNAGEQASATLERLGYATFDNGGRLIKNFTNLIEE